MVKYLPFFMLIICSLFGIATPAISGDSTSASNREGEKQVLDDSIKAIVTSVKALAARYLMSREDAKADKGFVSEERQGTSWFVTLVREGVKVELIYHDYRSIVAEAVTEDEQGRKRYVFYSDDGRVSQYTEGKNRMFDGVELDFHEDGTLANFIEFKDNRLLGREMEWDESGKLIRSVINDGSRQFTLKE
jgi:hypothetical protein